MSPAPTRTPVAAMVVYAALGVALGMVVWALALHGGGEDRGGGGGSFQQKQGQDQRTEGQPWRKDG